MTDRLVDFLVIGAARSGTSSFSKYLRAHPDIFIPLEKEISFFSDDEKFERGVDWYMGEYFSNTGNKRIKGEATPAYMLFDNVPQRIHDITPETKLIALLRNPIDRAYSHHRFAQRLGIENRGFEEAIDKLLRRGPIAAEQIDVQNLEYLIFGEYGRIIKKYLELFSKEQLKILFYEDLKTDPEATMRRTYEFLGVDETFESDIFHKTFNAGGTVRFKSVLRFQNWAKSNHAVKNFLMKIFPVRLLGAVDTWLTHEGNLKAQKDQGPGENMRKRLKDYYAGDVKLFRDTTGLAPPWPDFDP